MINQKNTGSYYTPSYLANFISKRVLAHFRTRTRISILEPSVGDGAFIEELNKAQKIGIRLFALDINSEELDKASKRWTKKNSSFVQSDFLEFESSKKYSAIIGNPPYVNKNRLTKKQVELSKEIHSAENLTEVSVKNIWTSFLVKSNTLLQKDGVLAFVLPSELLQVKFAEEIREYLKKEFNRIEIFTFNDLMFECKGQDTIVLFAYKKSERKGEFFANIESKERLEANDFILKSNNLLVSSKVKWTHHFLSHDELTFINRLKKELHSVDYYSESKPGIVTAANDFFIVDRNTVRQFNLLDHTIPIIQKGLFVNGGVVFNESDINQLEENNYPTRLLKLENKDVITRDLKKYLEIGEKKEIHTRYKCKLRSKWYVIPNISDKPDAFFFKRSHLYPKLLKNNSNSFVTDSAYKVKIRNEFDLNSFIFSFYNTFTLLLSEIEGRYYGGGVLELIPSEFKKLPLPYYSITDSHFDKFTERFESKNNIEEILAQNDLRILNHTLNINQEDINLLSGIRDKLKNKRMRR